MRTEHVNILLPDFIRGSLGREETDRIGAHLRSCPACRTDFEELSDAAAIIGLQRKPEVPQTYFATILPRVHERLENRLNSSWLSGPLVNRVVLPLGAAFVVAMLVWRMPVFSPEKQNPLAAIVNDASNDEIAEIVQTDSENHGAGSYNNAIITGMFANENFVDRELVREALASESISPFNVYADISPQQFLDDLGESDASNVLMKLETKGAL